MTMAITTGHIDGIAGAMSGSVSGTGRIAATNIAVTVMTRTAMVFRIVLTAIETMTVGRITGIGARTILTGDQLLDLRLCESCS
jgi:hypothetical protein